MPRTTAQEDAIPRGWRTRLPGSLLWASIGIIRVLFSTCFYSMYFLPRFTRPNSRWTYRQALMNHVMKIVFRLITDLAFTQPLSLKPGKLGERWVVMEPSPSEMYGDLLPANSQVKPEPIGATWYPSPPTKDGIEDGLVVLSFHSGSFLWATGRPDDCEYSAQLLLSRLGPGTRALFVQYRLAGDSKNPTPYPGPMQDALTAYFYVVKTMGIPPHRIVLAGDSSGGTVAVALIRHLQSFGRELQDGQLLGLPKACLLFSPAVNKSVEGDSRDMASHRNSKTDYIEGRMLAWGARAVAPPPIRLDHPDLSPALHPFATKVPIFAQAGSAEILCDAVQEFADAMMAIPGNQVEYLETRDAPHDIFMVGAMLGWNSEAEAIVDAAAEFLSRH